MKSAILSGKASLKLWNPTQSFNLLPPTVFPQFRSHLNSQSRAVSLRGFTTGCLGLSECRVAFPWHHNTSGRIFSNARPSEAVTSAKSTFGRQLRSYCFGFRNLDSANMRARQLRVRKEKEKVAVTTVQSRTLQNGTKSISESSPGEVEKLNKENFEVDSWQFQLLERHEANNLNSYTVAELRQLLREMKKQTKGQKSDLLKAVKKWLYDHGCPTPSALEEAADKGLEENSSNLETSEEVAVVSKTKATVKKTASKSTPQSNRKRRKDDDIGDNVVDSAQEEKPEKKVKSSKKGTKESALKVKTAMNNAEPWTVLVHKKPQPEWLAYDPKTMRPEPLAKEEKVVKMLSWNVNGLRALLKEKGIQHEQGSLIARLAAREDFDVLCLQETKLQEKDVEDIRKSLLASHEESLWSCSTSKLGYSGTAIISRMKPLSVHYGLGVPNHDMEGRLITCEFDSFYFIVSYVPNSGAKLERLTYRTQEWDVALSSYMKELEKKKPVILTGDLNCAYENIDIHDPAGNKRSAGFTDEERESFGTNFLGNGFVDTFRKQNPHAVAYTYWGYRTAARPVNRGWRLDYFLVSESLSKDVHDSYTLPDVGGSDHCPIGLILRA